MNKKMQFALGIALVGLFVASFAAIAPKAVKAAIATLVRDQDNVARHPFTTSCAGNNISNPIGTVTCFTTPIPAGEEVVIETVSFSASASASDTILVPFVDTTVSGTTQEYVFNPQFDSGMFQPTDAVFSLIQSVRLYADPGTQIQCGMRNINPTHKFTSCSISGYFVTLP